MEQNVVKSELGQFSKVTETARLPGWEFAADKAKMVLELNCVQILLILMGWILVIVALKKW